MSEDFDRPWPARRGIENIDYNNELILAKTDVATLAAHLATTATTWEPDVLGKSVRVERGFGWVFRLEGHAWTLFVRDLGGSVGSAEELSARLSVPVIWYGCSDTVGGIEYRYAEGGKIRESLEVHEGKVQFSSELREALVTRANAYDVADQFFRTREAYEPGVYPEYFFADGSTVPRLEPGQSRTVGNPGFVMSVSGVGETRTIPKFERVDYLTFGSNDARGSGAPPESSADLLTYSNWLVITLAIGGGVIVILLSMLRR